MNSLELAPRALQAQYTLVRDLLSKLIGGKKKVCEVSAKVMRECSEALVALGFEDVTPLISRVRYLKAPDEHTPYTHASVGPGR